MMKTLNKKILLPLLFFCFLPINANAIVLFAVQTDAAGGTAFVDCVGDHCFIEKVYEDVAPISIDFTVLNIGAPEPLFIDEFILNLTGDDWTDFHWTLEAGSPEWVSLHFVDASADGFDITTVFPAPAVEGLAISPIEPGSSFSAFLFIEYANAPGVISTFRLTQIPTIDTPSVPEPTTLLLLGVGLAGLGFARRG